jgi:hypothetical protein
VQVKKAKRTSIDLISAIRFYLDEIFAVRSGVEVSLASRPDAEGIFVRSSKGIDGIHKLRSRFEVSLLNRSVGAAFGSVGRSAPRNMSHLIRHAPEGPSSPAHVSTAPPGRFELRSRGLRRRATNVDSSGVVYESGDTLMLY